MVLKNNSFFHCIFRSDAPLTADFGTPVNLFTGGKSDASNQAVRIYPDIGLVGKQI